MQMMENEEATPDTGEYVLMFSSLYCTCTDRLDEPVQQPAFPGSQRECD